MYARIEMNSVIEYPLSEHDIRPRFPNVSFTTDFAANLPVGYVRVLPAGRPAEDELKTIREGLPCLIDGQWVQTWVQDDRFDAQELQAYQAQQLQRLEQQVRDRRNGLLDECDWTQLDDAQVDKAVWAAYRQALRDVPSQAGFPSVVVWPTKP